MSSDIIKEKLAAMGPIPGLSDWQKRTVLLLRCQDITKDEFLAKVNELREIVNKLYEESLPDSMEEETYMVAKEYYDKANIGLDCYLSGLDCLIDFASLGDSSILEEANEHFAEGDRHSAEMIPIALEMEENFKQSEEAVMRSLGLDPEGIG